MTPGKSSNKPFILHSGMIARSKEELLELVTLNDIIFGLENTNRFGGQLGRCSVATHSVIVADMVVNSTSSPLLELHALMHDQVEALFGEVTNGAKTNEHRRIEADFNKKLNSKWGLESIDAERMDVLKKCDQLSSIYEIATGGMDGFDFMDVVEEHYPEFMYVPRKQLVSAYRETADLNFGKRVREAFDEYGLKAE